MVSLRVSLQSYKVDLENESSFYSVVGESSSMLPNT